MNKHYFSSVIVVIFLAMIVASCSKSSNGKIEYVPFQETKDGLWGLISMDGEVLFSEEFKETPTVVRDGRFFVRNKEGLWEMYEASEKPKKIGADYVHVSGFNNGRALVTEQNKHVSIIDTDGKIIKVLDKIEGKEVDGVNFFNNGYAVFTTTDTLCGVIDQNGTCVIKPEYIGLTHCYDGKFMGVHMKYKKDNQEGNRDKVKISVINTSGEVLFNFSQDKYERFHFLFYDDKLAVSEKIDGEEAWGIINDKGEYIVKPSKKLKAIGTIKGDHFTYYNGEGWGLMDISGEVLIRAKYEDLEYAHDDILLATIKDRDNYIRKFIDKNDNQIGEDTFTEAYSFNDFDKKHTFVKPNDKFYSIINKKCEQIKGLPDIVNISVFGGETYVQSDFVDLKKYITTFDITQEGALGLNFSSSPATVVKEAAKSGDISGTKDHPAESPYWWDYRYSVSFNKAINNSTSTLSVIFPGVLSHQIYEYFYYLRIPTGKYAWNDIKPAKFSLEISNDGRMRGKLRALYEELSKRFAAMGIVKNKNNSAMTIALKNGRSAFVYMTNNKVTATWGDFAIDNIDIDRYKDAHEGSNTSDNDSYEDYDSDSIWIDSVIVDSL